MQTAVTQSGNTQTFPAAAATLSGKIVLGLLATVVVAAAAHVAIPLPFTPVPLTLQPLAVLGVGLALEPVTGFFAMLAYLLEGLCGIPVFSPTGPGGVAQLFGPTGGFLMAYPLVAAIAGGSTSLVVRRLPRFLPTLVGCTAAVCLLFVSGAGWLMHFAHLSLHQTWIAAIAPFLPGEVVKVLAAAGIYSTLHRSIQQRT